MKKINWRKGAGEFIAYAVTISLLCYLLIIIIGFVILSNATGNIENAVTEISRNVIVCDSLTDAQTMAQEQAVQYLGQFSNIDTNSIVAEVGYAAGADAEWKKGGFVEVTISAYVNTCEPFTSGTKSSSTLMMIENSEGGE